MTTSARVIKAAVGAAAVFGVLATGLPNAGAAPAQHQVAVQGLPIGDADLAETRTVQTLARGVTLTRIVRGTDPAPADQINTTPRGPWVVNVLTIDPRTANGHLKATYGPDLARVEKTSDLVKSSGALAGVNASFFTFTANPQYPGDPVGLGLFDGKLLSEPLADPTEANLVIDAKSNRVVTGHLRWTGAVRNRFTGAELPLEFLNHPPVIPAACATLPDQTACTVPGDVVRFTPEFAASTPAGAGVEVVLDRRGCVVRTSTTRGTALSPSQTSLQATGQDTVALLALAKGCLRTDLAVSDETGRKVPLRSGLYGVTGRYQLTKNGEIVVPDGTGSFFDRNPRTIAGTTRGGKIVLATIDGRQTTSVGTTMDETAAVAKALGLSDAINLDGGGSTAMALGDGTVVNHPSSTGGAERAVGDAVVFVPGR
ncbi:phosphodiester glycosidase family protein [Kribbella speibonae]|uniref:Phosphodiester glycosidase family protein n=1 Tax=Kribbella speibonae TaxID=1572660 RepID=A0A4R0IZI5_9ACTN|nr:phosphodiester glycosidase family protein [Kribbella speibonae]TCC26660.1 phosphodiester glycosidase family protein [Kribbella speibonae]TCC38747.1 phosphodiester glycosidase family protein [Kribbella speibonae]